MRSAFILHSKDIVGFGKKCCLAVGLTLVGLWGMNQSVLAQIDSSLTTVSTWTGSGAPDTAWSTAGNWSTAPTSATSSVILFNNTSLGTTSTVDTSMYIGALIFGSTSGTVVSGVPGYTLNGTGTLTISSVTYSGAQYPVAIFNNSTATQTISNNLYFNTPLATVKTAANGGALVINGNVVSGVSGSKVLFDTNTNAPLYLNGAISGAGGARYNGVGAPTSTIYLNGANTYTGATSVQTSTLYVGTNSAINQAGAFGSSSGVIAIGYTGFSNASTAVLMNGNYQVDRSFGFAGSTGATNTTTFGSVVTGASTFSGQITIDGSTAATPYAAQAVNVTAATGGTVYFTGSNSANNSVFYRTITASGTADSLTKSGGGTVVLGKTSNYQGYTAINAGTLSVGILANGGTTSSIGISSSASSNLQFNGGALQYTGAAVNTDRLFTVATNGGTIDSSGTGAVHFTNTGVITQSGASARTLTLSGTNTNHNELSSALTDYSATYKTSVSKSGAGTWVLVGANTYTGTTSVDDGKLLVTGSITGTGGAVTVANAALLGGNGTISGRSVSVANGGTISAGDMTDAGVSQTGTLTLDGGLILNNTSHLAFDLGTSSDLIAITGNLTLDGILDLSNAGGFGAGTYHLLTYTGTLTNNTLDLGNTIAGYSYVITAAGGNVDLVVTAIPEPSSMALLMIGATSLLAGRRLRRR